MAKKRTRRTEYIPPGSSPGEGISFIDEETIFNITLEDDVGEAIAATFRNVTGMTNPLAGSKSERGEFDVFNPFRYLADVVQITKGYKSAFERGEAIFASFVLGPENLKLNGEIDTGTLAEVFAGVDNKRVHRLKQQILRGKFKVKKGRTLTVTDLALIMSAIERVFSNEVFIQRVTDIVRALYDQFMRPEIARNVPESLRRGGGSGGVGASRSFEEGRGKGKKFWADAKGSGQSTDFTKYWTVMKEILTKPINKVQTVSTGAGNFRMVIAPFSIDDLLKVRISGTRSRFNSMYLMAEFGTGVKASYPRAYKSQKFTPFKVSPPLAALFQRVGVNASPFSWSTNRGILAMLGNNPKAKGTPVNVLNEFSSLYAQRKRTKGAHNRQLQIDAYSRKLHRYATYVFGKDDQTSIKPQKILLDQRGIVKNIREAYKRYLSAIAKNIEFEITDRVKADLAGRGKHTVINGKKVYASPEAQAAATLGKFFPKGFIQFTVPESVFDISSYQEILRQLKGNQ